MTSKKNFISKTLPLFIFGAIALCAVVFVLFVFQKKTYLVVDLYITGGEWWWDTAKPPYWLGNPVTKGATEYDIQGKRVVEVLGVQKFEEASRKTMIVKARLLVTKNLRTKKYRFKQNPLEIGTTISLSPGSIQMYGNVIGIEGVQDFSQTQKQVVLTRWYNVFPWQADAITIGDTMKSGSGQEVARIIGKEVSIAEKTIVTENNQNVYGATSNQTGRLILLRSDPLRRDVTLLIEIMTTQAEEQNFFGYVQLVKVGESLLLSLPNIVITPIIISLNPVAP